jgi:hypothetical protein
MPVVGWVPMIRWYRDWAWSYRFVCGWRRMLEPMRVLARSTVVCLLTMGLRLAAHGQTADPAAAPPSTATTAPPAHTGSYSVQNGELVVAPGLRIPNGNVPWALDMVDGKQVLVPVHHAALATSSASMGTLDGATSKTALRSSMAAFFVHTSDRTENTGDSGRGSPTGWALVSAEVSGNARNIPRAKFSQVNGATVCAAPILCSTAESLPEGWLRITPKDPLAPGEYVLLPVPRNGSNGAVVVYDFNVSDQSATPKDAVAPGQNLDSVAKGKKKRAKN